MSMKTHRYALGIAANFVCVSVHRGQEVVAIPINVHENSVHKSCNMLL